MNAWAQLAPFAALGLAGSLHCAGMCGPFALSLTWSRERERNWPHALLYVAAKSLAYALIAVVLASVVSTFASGAQPRAAGWLADSRSILAVVAGLAMVLLALHSLGVPLWPRRVRLGAVQRAMGFALRSVRALPAPAASFGLGLVNGFLPCGLSWAAIALALTAQSWVTVIGPIVFGLATGPMLVSIALGGAAVPIAWRVRGQRIAAVLLLAFGAWTLTRGGALGHDAAAATQPECCTEPVSADS